MEQAKPLQLVSPDLLLETVNTMRIEELDFALDGIAMASNVEEMLDQSPAEAVEIPFGDQLMKEVNSAHDTDDDPALNTKEPVPTFSASKGGQKKDDGGTGPGADE